MTKDFGPKPKLVWLPVKRLTVDMRYQRTLESSRSQKLIERMVADFKWQRFGAVLAAPSAMDNYALIDGQHRVEVLKRLGEPEAPAILLESASLAEQAGAFVAANRDRVTVNPFALHHAMVQAADPIAVAVDKLCRATGISIPRYPLQAANMKPGQTLALGALKKLASLPNHSHAVRALKVLMAAFPDEPGALRAHAISGAAQFIARNPLCNDEALTEALTDAGLLKLEKTVWQAGGSVARNAAVEEYMATALRRSRPKPNGDGIAFPDRKRLMAGR